MKVIQATAKGMCFGVRDALEVAFKRDDASKITIWGELVHNEAVNDKLRELGYRMCAESDRGAFPDTDRVLITAHGISDQERRRLENAGKTLIDTTCPLVQRVHDAAKRLERDGYHVVVIGKPGHVEVRGITGDLVDYRVVSSTEDVGGDWNICKIGVVCQSTTKESVARDIVDAIQRGNADSEVRFLDTICDPTKQRVLALETLIPRSDAIVVVGGKNSNNTKQLVATCEQRGVRAYHVQGPEDLDPAWFEDCDVVGLTAGTSTLDWTIAKVHHALTLLPTKSGAPV